MIFYTVVFFCSLFFPIPEAQARGTKAMNTAMRFMYASGFWILKDRGIQLGRWLLCFLQAYQVCARITFGERRNRFPLMPKLHYIHHDSLTLIYAPPTVKWVRNPLTTTNQMQEDYVGKPSRLSRRVAVPQLHSRVMSRCLISAYHAILASDKDERGLK